MEYQIHGTSYPVSVIRKNNKNTYIRIKENSTIQVTTHYFMTKKQIQNLLKQNESSIYEMILKSERILQKKEEFYYLGKKYYIIWMPVTYVEIFENNIYTSDQKQLNRWYQKQIKEILTKRYQYCYEQFIESIPFPTLKFRNMKTRWGVCNRKSKTITLNTQLVRYDIDQIDYVIIHELSHLIHFNHSKEFWRVVETYCPNYKQMKKILQE